MKVTNVKLFPSKTPKTKAYGSVTFDGEVQINVTIFEKDSGPFVGWPGHMNPKDNKWYGSVFFPMEQTKAEVNGRVLQEYNKLVHTDQALAQKNDTGSQIVTQNPAIPF